MKDDRVISASLAIMTHAKVSGNDNLHKIASTKLLEELVNFHPSKIIFNSDEYWNMICWQARIKLHQEIDKMFYCIPYLDTDMSNEMKEYLDLMKYYTNTMSEMCGVNTLTSFRNKFINLPPSA